MEPQTPLESILSGQQASFLGGPLFVLSKIVGIATLSKETKLHPIFWIETNDSDFEEARHAYLLSGEGELQHISIGNSNKIAQPRIGDREMDTELLSALDLYFSKLEKTSHSKELKDFLKTSYSQAPDLGTATLLFFQTLFREWGKSLPPLRFFDPRDLQFLNFAGSFLLKEAELTQEGEQCPFFLWNAKNPHEKSSGNSIIPLFPEERKTRLSIFKKGDAFFLRSGKRVDINTATLLPHLLTRSILQDAYFHAKYYLAGPHEKVYLDALKPRYLPHKVRNAEIISRLSLLVMESADSNLLQLCLGRSRREIDEKTLRDFVSLQEENIVSFLLETHTSFDAQKYKTIFAKCKADYIDDLQTSGIPQNILRLAEKKLYREQKHLLGRLRKEARNSIKERERWMRLLKNRLSPNPKGLPSFFSQERNLNFVYFLNRYGKDFISLLAENYPSLKELKAGKTNKILVYPNKVR